MEHHERSRKSMIYLRHYPSSPLKQYIYHFYYLEGHMPFSRERILPVAHFDLKINLASPHSFYEHKKFIAPQDLKEVWLTGIFNRYHHVEWPNHVQLYGARLRAGGLQPVIGVPGSVVHNQVISLETIWGTLVAEIRDKLNSAATIQKGFGVLERILSSRLYAAERSQPAVDFAILNLERNWGNLSVKRLSEIAGLSGTHLRRRVKETTGTSIKEMAKLYRFESVLRSVNPSPTTNWANIAHAHNFYDQSHLYKDFQTFTGLNPSQYIDQRSKVYKENAIVDQKAYRNLPIG